jgi:hypothetical protein
MFVQDFRFILQISQELDIFLRIYFYIQGHMIILYFLGIFL